MISATTHEGSTSVDVGAIRERLLPGVSHVASCVVSDIAKALARASSRRTIAFVANHSSASQPDGASHIAKAVV